MSLLSAVFISLHAEPPVTCAHGTSVTRLLLLLQLSPISQELRRASDDATVSPISQALLRASDDASVFSMILRTVLPRPRGAALL